MTKCMLITAITKLHSNINFSQLDFINNLIEKYSRDQNVEIQQRCLEYKRLLKSQTSILKNQFTTILDELDIDHNLSFLDGFVANKIRGGGKVYDRSRYEQENNLFDKVEKPMVTAPYQAPENIDSTPSLNSNKLTSLYDDRQDYQRKVGNAELKVGSGQMWTKTGYVAEQKKPVGTTVFSPPISSSVSNMNVSSNMGNNNSNTVVSSGNTAFSNVSSGPINKNMKNETMQYVPKKKEVVYDPKKEEKDILKNSLFGGLTKLANPQNPISSNICKFIF